MIKFEHTETAGWEAAIRGMRNPLNSWGKSDTKFQTACVNCEWFNCCEADGVDFTPTCSMEIGENDKDLMTRLNKGGTEHSKYRRFLVVYTDVIAPLYWWKEFDTYKVGTVANSCSTMHTIHREPFEIDDFSHEHLDDVLEVKKVGYISKLVLEEVIEILNHYRDLFLETNDKKYWWYMIQLLPTSYNQRRTVMLNYEVLANIYRQRKNHKLDEWRQFCEWIENLPYSELITGVREDESGDE